MPVTFAMITADISSLLIALRRAGRQLKEILAQKSEADQQKRGCVSIMTEGELIDEVMLCQGLHMLQHDPRERAHL